jgi:hypothetical protein
MKTTTSTKSSTRSLALYTVYGNTARSMPQILGQLWTKADTATMWMAKVKLTTDPLELRDEYIYAKSTNKDALVSWILANTMVKGVKSSFTRRTSNGYWDKVVARRIERNFTSMAASV